MTTLSDQDQLERMRMCVAEAGYPGTVYDVRGASALIDQFLPSEIGWRAREICGLGVPMCFLCTEDSRRPEFEFSFEDQCRAVRRLELDCGRPR